MWIGGARGGERKGRGAPSRRGGAPVTATLRERLERDPEGVHRLGDPAHLLDAELPASAARVYREMDGAELFHESVVLDPSRTIRREGGWYRVGEAGGDEIYVSADRGEVYRLEADTGEMVPDGTGLDRWLAGFVDAEATLYGQDGEFRDGIFTESGELTAEAALRRERAALKRDRRAAGPRWRLARALVQLGRLEEARDELEEAVAAAPHFGWAYYDLARISEALGELDAAQGDAEAAAEADPEYEHAALFWAHAARIAALRGDEAARAHFADRALAKAPELAAAQRDGAAERLKEGARDEAVELAHVALALAPRDLQALELLRRLEAESLE